MWGRKQCFKVIYGNKTSREIQNRCLVKASETSYRKNSVSDLLEEFRVCYLLYVFVMLENWSNVPGLNRWHHSSEVISER